MREDRNDRSSPPPDSETSQLRLSQPDQGGAMVAVRGLWVSEHPHGAEQQEHRDYGHTLVNDGCRLAGLLTIACIRGNRIGCELGGGSHRRSTFQCLSARVTGFCRCRFPAIFIPWMKSTRLRYNVGKDPVKISKAGSLIGNSRTFVHVQTAT